MMNGISPVILHSTTPPGSDDGAAWHATKIVCRVCQSTNKPRPTRYAQLQLCTCCVPICGIRIGPCNQMAPTGCVLSPRDSMPPRSVHKTEAPRAASPPPVVRAASPARIPAQGPPLNKSSQSAPAPSAAAQTIPSALVWIAFSASLHLSNSAPIKKQDIFSVCKWSAIVFGIALALSSAHIIPKLGHHVLLFVTAPLYVLGSSFSRVNIICGHLFQHSGKITAYLSNYLNDDQQHALSLALLLLVIYAVSGKSTFGREAALVLVYSSLSYFILTPESAPVPALTESVLSTVAVLLLLAIHQFLNAPNAPAAFRNVFLATVYYIMIKFLLTI